MPLFTYTAFLAHLSHLYVRGGCNLIYLKDIFIENGDIQVIYLIGSDKIEDCTDMSWYLIKMDEYKIRLREKQFKKLGI